MNGSIPKAPITWSRKRLLCLVLAGFLISLFSVFAAFGQDKNPIPAKQKGCAICRDDHISALNSLSS